MKLSIITVNYRSWGHLETALTTLQAGFPDDWEMIVVDNESDATQLAAFSSRFPWTRFIANPKNSGFGFGCVIGTAEASGEYLLFMNPDVVAKVADISLMLEATREHSQFAIFAPSQVDSAGRPQKVFDEFPDAINQSKTLKALRRWLFPNRHPDPRRRHQSITQCDWVTGSVLLISRADYDTIGGWSPDYWMYAEDADLCRKAEDHQLATAYLPTVQVVHAHGGSSRINVAVKSMTKREVIISKHVYAKNHKRGGAALAMHAMIVACRLPPLLIGSLLDAITLRQIPTLRVRSGMLGGLLSYYGGVIDSGSWLSPRAKENQSE